MSSMSLRATAAGRPARQRTLLVALIALFLLPLVLAWVLVGHWRPSGSAEHGELLVPARPLPQAFITAHALHGRWTLVYLATGPGCDAACRGALYRLRQVRLATGKDIDRVQRLALWLQPADAATRQWLAVEHAGLAGAGADAAAGELQPFTAAWSTEGAVGRWIYLADPLGNLVLRYPADVDAKGILSDLQRLLKLSKIG